MKFSKVGFPPIIGGDPKILILGSMPGDISLKQSQYYAHPRNAFWYIAGNLFDFNVEAIYSDKKAQLIKNRIALWDVLQECKRDGSLDSSIIGSSIKTNEFSNLLLSYPSIQLIIFNGATAEKEYMKRVLPDLKENMQSIKTIRLPSTSPAMAALSKEQKLVEWSVLIEASSK